MYCMLYQVVGDSNYHTGQCLSLCRRDCCALTSSWIGDATCVYVLSYIIFSQPKWFSKSPGGWEYTGSTHLLWPSTCVVFIDFERFFFFTSFSQNYQNESKSFLELQKRQKMLECVRVFVIIMHTWINTAVWSGCFLFFRFRRCACFQDFILFGVSYEKSKIVSEWASVFREKKQFVGAGVATSLRVGCSPVVTIRLDWLQIGEILP